MAYFRRCTESFSPTRTVQIVGSETCENYTVYVVEVRIGQYKWYVRHRYAEFHDLHEKLVTQFKLDRTLLPKKKLFGNQTEKFVRKRQTELEVYLQKILHSLPTLPYCLITFLDFHKYEVHGITQALSELLFRHGDLILESSKTFHMTPLQLNAINTRLKLAEPTCDSLEASKDLGHLLDFVTRAQHLQIDGTTQHVGSSNINMNELPFDLHCFKSLTTLELTGCNVLKMSEVEHLKKCLVYLRAYNSLSKLKDILLVGVGVGQWLGVDNETVVVEAWSEVVTADFSHNVIDAIDESVKLLPRIERLSLRHNRLEDINHLQFLSRLRILDLSHNNIRRLVNLHSRLGNITAINVSWNKLDSLQGLAKVYSLQSIDASHNAISQVTELVYLSSLPCLERIHLQGNPVTTVLEYRATMFELFADRASEVCLDGQKASPQELDMVAVRVAINKSRQSAAATTTKHKRKAAVKEAKIAESVSSSSHRLEHRVVDSDACCSSSRTEFNAATRHDTDTSSLDDTRHSVSSLSDTQLTVPTENDTQLIVPSFPLGFQPAWRATSIESNSTSSPVNYFMLPETLPTSNDKSFVCHVTSEYLEDIRTSITGQDDDECIIHILWCAAICYHQPETEFPAGIFIATHYVHIFAVEALAGASSSQQYPLLRHVFCLPLANVQRVAVGYGGLYVQIEEAQAGEHGTFTLLTMNSRKTDLFVSSFKRALRHSIPDLDDYEDPNVASAGDMSAVLLQVLCQYEVSDDIDILLYMLGSVVDSVDGQFVTRSIVITSRYIYIIRQDYVNQPPPTFILASSSNSPAASFEPIAIFSVMGRITAIHMYDTGTELDLTGAAASKTAAQFAGYGVQLTFVVDPPTGSQTLDLQTLDLRVSSSCMRDCFLTTLTQARSASRDTTEVTLSLQVALHTDDASSGGSGGSTGKHMHRKAKKGKMVAGTSVINKQIVGAQRTSSAPDLASGTTITHLESRYTLTGSTSAAGCTSALSPTVPSVITPGATKDRAHNEDLRPVDEWLTTVLAETKHGQVTSSVDAQVTLLPTGEMVQNEQVTMLSQNDVVTTLSENSTGEQVSGDNNDVSVSTGVINVNSELNLCSRVSDAGSDLWLYSHLEPASATRPRNTQQTSADGETFEHHLGICSANEDDFCVAGRPESDGVDTVSEESTSDADSTSKQEQVSQRNSATDITDVANQFCAVSTQSIEECINDTNSVCAKYVDAVQQQRIETKTNDTESITKSKMTVDSETNQFADISCCYPSEDLLSRLDVCQSAAQSFVRASPGLNSLADKSALDLVNYFHLSVAPVDSVITGTEERLCHALWAPVITLSRPMREIPSCILLSTRAIYFISDYDLPESPPPSTTSSTQFAKLHCRHSSDEVRSLKISRNPRTSGLRTCDQASSVGRSVVHLSCGLLNDSTHSRHNHIAKVYSVITLAELRQVHVGIFDQMFRLTGSSSLVLACVTRDHRLTEEFLRQLSNVLNEMNVKLPTEAVEPSVAPDGEPDFYHQFRSRRTATDSLQSKHVRIIYPPDEAVVDLSFLVRTHLRGKKPAADSLRILFYLLCFQSNTLPVATETGKLLIATGRLQPRTLILTEEHVAMAVEDHVSYPLPDFARMLPDHPHTDVIDVRYLEFLKRIVVTGVERCVATFVFVDETGEIIVDTSIEYYSADQEVGSEIAVREVAWVLVATNADDLNRLLKVVGLQWSEFNDGQLLEVIYTA